MPLGRVGDGGSTESASDSETERREPEDSIAESESSSEADPMTDIGSTTSSPRDAIERRGETTPQEQRTARGGSGDVSGGGTGDADGTGSGSDGDSGPDRSPGSGPGGLTPAGDDTTTDPGEVGTETGTDPVPETDGAPTDTVGGTNGDLPPPTEVVDQRGEETPQEQRTARGENPDPDRTVTEPADPVNWDVVDEETAQQGPDAVRDRLEQTTTLEAGEDFFVTQTADGAYQVGYTDEGRRELAAAEFDARFDETIDAEDIELQVDGGARLSPDAQQDVAEDRLADRLGVTTADIDVSGNFGAGPDVETDLRITPQTETGAGAIATFQLRGQADVENVETEQVAPGIVRATGDRSTEGGEAMSPDVNPGVTVATPEGQELLADMNELSDVRADSAEQIQEFEAFEAGQEADRRTEQMMDAFQRGAYGDPQDIRDDTDGDGGVPPRQQIETDLEEATGVELSRSDIEFAETTEDGETVITGRLSSAGEETVARETAPGQGIPVVEGVFEAGAELNYEYGEFAEANRDRVEGVLPDFGGIGSDVADAVPGRSDFYGAAAAAAPFAVAEPTPAGEVGVGALVATGTAVGVAGAAATWAAGADSDPGPSSEVDVPSSGTVFGSELAVSGNAQQFPSELQTPTGVTSKFNRGELQPGDLYVDELEATGTTVDELDVPGSVGSPESDRGSDGERPPGTEEYPTPEASGAVDAPGGSLPTGGEMPAGPSTPSGPTLPANEGGFGTPAGGIAGRELPGRDYGGASGFFDVALTEPYSEPAVLESAQQSSVGGSAAPTMPLSGVVDGAGTSETGPFDLSQTRSPPTTDVGAPGTSMAESPAFAESFSSPLANANASAPAFEQGQQFEFGNPNAPEYAYEFPFGFGTSSPRERPRLPDPDDDTGGADDATIWDEQSRQFERELTNPLAGPDDSDAGSNDDDGTLFGGFL